MLAEDRVLTQEEKERVITTAVCSVFSYSAGFVDWTKAELDRISRWIPAHSAQQEPEQDDCSNWRN